ncbi:hypothetical protein RRG08_003176 [Elysia crispata]|uniref:Uncharacterized protein n=1 Tax=Elysia crispata TaxID=231223 RepID=A0AAE1B8Y6_9GAST|nr:hypothetical protein RRG08_003176 [Elysia crispata]
MQISVDTLRFKAHNGGTDFDPLLDNEEPSFDVESHSQRELRTILGIHIGSLCTQPMLYSQKNWTAAA